MIKATPSDWLTLLREPALIVSVHGELLEANAPFRKLVASNGFRHRRLADVVADPDDELRRQLRQWARSKAPIPGALRLRTSEGEVTYAVEAGRLTPAGEDQLGAVLLRIRPRHESGEQFRLLQDKVEALSREVAARRHAEQNAHAQQRWFRTTLLSIGDGVITTDPDQRIDFMNPVAERLTGWSVDEAHGRPFAEVFRIINEKTREPAADPCAQAVETRQVVALANHTALIARDGTERAIEDTAAPILTPDGELIGAVIVFHDVTDRRQREEQIRQQEEWFRTTLSSIGDGVIATDERGHVAFMNPVAERLTGWSSDDARGRDSLEVFNIINEDTRQTVESPVTRVIREGVVVGLANLTLLIARDGTERPIDDSGAPIRNGNGELVGTVLVFRDISDRKAAEQALRESEQRFRTMADAAPVLIWVAGPDGKSTYFNRQWLAFTGRSMDQELGDGWLEGVHPDDRQRCLHIYREAFEARNPFRMEYRLRRHDGEWRWMLDQGVPRYTPDRAFAGYIGSCIDITDHRQAEQQLLSLNDVLEERVAERTAQLRELAVQLTQAEQKERRRLAQVLHDHLQQTLVAARMRTDLLLHRTDDPDLRDAGEQVRQLIGESIEASRSLTLELSPPVLYDGGLCAALPWLARRMEQQHDLKVEVQTDSAAEPHEEETRVALFFAARELLFNVAKHARVNEARVTLGRAEAGKVRLAVEDHGAGFDPEMLQRDREGQAGFGLFSLKERIEFLGGTMELQSSPGGGTQVHILVPQGKSAFDPHDHVPTGRPGRHAARPPATVNGSASCSPTTTRSSATASPPSSPCTRTCRSSPRPPTAARPSNWPASISPTSW